jgi:hypothetical protein
MPRHKKKRPNRGARAAAQPVRRHNAPTPASEREMRAGGAEDGWVRVKLSAELFEDAHPGSGSGGGGIDALVARDRLGRPVIWASHIEGVLRDAARRLRGADEAAEFFGRAGGQQQRAVFTSLYARSDRETRIWRSTARAAFDNRAPRDETLRVVEYVPKGTRFEGLIELPASDRPLLRRLLLEVDALGGGRATGSGRVRLSLAETMASPRPVGNPTDRLVLLLRNLDPLCITATATPDNLIPSLAFVPGRALLGALANWLIAEGRKEVATLLVNGLVSVSDALPVPYAPATLAEAEVLPAPLSLQSEKPAGSAGPIPWWAQASAAPRRIDSHSPAAQGLRLKRPEHDLFVYRGAPDEPWIAHRPQLRVRLRNGRPDLNQADPSLFAIEQIVEDTLLLCELRGTPDDMRQLAAGLKPVLEGGRWLRVGRAGAPVEVAQLSWPMARTHGAGSLYAILTLTSDLLIRDEHLRWRTALDQASFHQLPGWPANLRVSPIAQDIVAVHGFNGTSRLWRMPAYGVRRGSVFKVEGDGVAELARMATDGRWLGERTHEGFGRFRLDEILPGVTDGTSAKASATPSPSDEPDDAIAAATRQWCKDHPALAKAGGASDRRPSLSQWLDLVGALERNEPDALTSRQNPTTVGGKNWRDSDARKILDKLAAIQGAAEKTSHARLFVRWLRAEMRGVHA